MDIQNLNLEFQLSLAEKLAGLQSSKFLPKKNKKSTAVTKSLASNLPQKLVETRICMHERELDALESMAQLQQRDTTISRLAAETAELREALTTSQRAARQIQSQLQAFSGITPQDVNSLREENASLKAQLAGMQQQLHTQAEHNRDLTQCATRVQSVLKKQASDVSNALDKKDAECRALQSQQELLKNKVTLLEAAVDSKHHNALQSSLDLENSNLNRYTVRNGINGGYDDVMKLQKELAAALNRVRERESQCRKYKDAVRALKFKLEEEQQRRNEAEDRANISIAQSTAASAREQQVKEASREACAAAVRLAERRAVEAEGKVVTLEAALSQQQSCIAKNQKSSAKISNEDVNLKREKDDQDRLSQARALNTRLRQELQQEQALRASQTKALAEAEKRMKQLDGIVQRLAAHSSK